MFRLPCERPDKKCASGGAHSQTNTCIPSNPGPITMNLTESFLQFALLGANWVLWVLVLLSVASVAVIVERMLYFKSIAGKDKALAKPLLAALEDRDLEAARATLKDAESPGARMVAAILDGGARSTSSARALVDATRPDAQVRLSRFLAFLGTVGSNAPFIGLFGTVLEILRVFNLLGARGVTSGSEAAGIMTGISEALVATAIGLLVAIPAVIAYNALQRKVKRLMSEAEGLVNVMLATLTDNAALSDGRTPQEQS